MTTFRKYLVYFAQTALFVYLTTFTLSLTFIRFKEGRWHAEAAGLSRLQPPYRYLTRLADGKEAFDRKQVLYYRLFFSQLAATLHDRPDANGMLGFCEYQLGNIDRAIAAYKKAVDKASYFLWFNHNLAVIYFQKRDYAQAGKYASQAVRSSPDVIMKFLLASKVYMDAIASVPTFQDEYSKRMQTGFRDSYKMLVFSYYKQGRFSEMIVVADLAVNQKLDDDGFFYYYLGMGAFQLKEYERAALYLREALRLNPQAPEPYYYLALTLKAMGRDEMALPALQKAEILGTTKGPSYDHIKNLRVRIL